MVANIRILASGKHHLFIIYHKTRHVYRSDVSENDSPVTESRTMSRPSASGRISRILHECSFHVKFMKLAFGEFHKFHMK